MIIILEGCDKCGKTTLANKLSETYQYPIVHFGAPKNKQECEEMFDMYMSKMHDNIIMDRSWYSDLVYGPIFRGFKSISEEQLRILESMLIRRGCVIYHCYDTAENIMQRVDAQGDEFTNNETVQQILDGFEEVMSNVAKGITIVKYKIPGKAE